MVMRYYIRTCEVLESVRLQPSPLIACVKISRLFFKLLKVAADLNHDVAILLLRIVTMDPEQTARW